MTAATAGFIAAQRTGHGVPHAVACTALDVAPSTFYKHHRRRPTGMQLRRQAVDAEVKKAFDDSDGTYGSPRVRAQLRREGTSASKKTVEASMARSRDQLGFRCLVAPTPRVRKKTPEGGFGSR